MSKGVSKHCSILNYLRHNDAELFELIQDLCIGKIFIPRKGSAGLTFLHPDKALLSEIQSAAASDNPELAIDMIHSLVLLDYMPKLSSFEDKKSDIPTYRQKKLQVETVDGKSVTLANGAVITVDKDFQSRTDRGNISVYNLSKKLVPIDGVTATGENATLKAAKKGGAELRMKRANLFENVLRTMCESDRDTAMELIVALYGWCDKNDQKPLAELIASLSSYDTLATLAVVLQPYKSGSKYVSDEVLTQFAAAACGGSDLAVKNDFAANTQLYTFNPKAKELYESVLAGSTHDKSDQLKAIAPGVAAKMGKLNAVSLLKSAYESNRALLPEGRNAASVKELFAESELRVMSAMIQENSDGSLDMYELMALFRNCNLDEPYICADKDLIKSANVGFYFSTVYLIARSDALMYVPGMSGENTSNIGDESAFISLNDTFKSINQSRRNASQALISSLHAQVLGGF